MVQAERILNDYDLSRQQPRADPVRMKDNNSLLVAEPVVERYVEEYKANHPLGEGWVRYSLPEGKKNIEGDSAIPNAIDTGKMGNDKNQPSTKENIARKIESVNDDLASGQNSENERALFFTAFLQT